MSLTLKTKLNVSALVALTILIVTSRGFAAPASPFDADSASTGALGVATDASSAQRLFVFGSPASSISKDAAPPAIAKSPFVHSEPRGAAPFPLLLNQAVRSYVEDFIDQPKGLEAAFVRSRPFFSEMVDELKAQGVPDDLVYLTFAESSFSKAGKGPWQFTAVTAARFGLR
ncbi:MAG TPA: hypothetical protein VMT64_03740, partial [Candidatus Binataceae bacterium]|nr:hypothetical protein [Candidatus Binataceae bacterium]